MKRALLVTSLVTSILILVITQFVAALPSLATAVAGDLDTTFGSGGVSIADIGTASGDKAFAVMEQASGKIVVAGTSDDGGTDDFAVMRLTALGAADSTFSGDGKVTTAIGSASDIAYGVAEQADNKIVVAGSTFDGVDENFAVVRYGTNGTPDSSFSGDGILEIPITDGDDVAKAVVIQEDGKIVVVGSADGDFALVRIKANGELDDTFTVDGIVTTDFFGSHDEGHAVALDPVDGSIIVAGFADTGSSEEFAAARYDSSGVLDSSFGGTGKVTTDFLSNSVDQAFSVALQNDGKIVLAGFVNSGGGGTDDFALARYGSNGLLDDTFSDDGMVVTPIGSGSDQAYGVSVRPTGKIVVAGFVDTGGVTKQDFAVARYGSDGVLDSNFGGGSGYVLTDLGTINSLNKSADEAYGMDIQADEKILVAGFSDYPAGNDNFAVVRYLSPNSKPTLSDFTMEVLEDVELTYDATKTLASFYDVDDDDLAKVKIGSLPVTGTLALDGIPVTVNQEILPTELDFLTYNAPADWNGMVEIAWNGSDGLTYADEDASAFITVAAVNDAPSFNGGGNQEIAEDAGPQSVPAWASAVSPGPADEASQVLTFVVGSNNDSLFAAVPAIDATTGDLTFTPADNKNGIAKVSVTLMDNGGTVNMGEDSSVLQNFWITINPVNDAPVIDNFMKHQIDDNEIPFLVSDFEDRFHDIDGDMLAKVKIASLPANGRLALNGSEVVVGQEIMVEKLDELVFGPQAGWTGLTEFSWNGSDGLAYAVADASVTLSVTEPLRFYIFLPVIIGES